MTEFCRIGAGFCGSVWTPPSNANIHFGKAFKREAGGPGRSVLKDFEMHQRLLDAYQNSPVPVSIRIPKLFGLIIPDDTWWSSYLVSFPSGYSPCNMIMSERIPAVPQEIRELLVDTYCPISLSSEIKSSEANRDCLIRPYLGRCRYRDADRPSRLKTFSLRNYLLHLDQMRELNIAYKDMVRYAQIMADALALMHWRAAMDANDVKFVLAPTTPQQDSDIISNRLGDHVMWVLDFDCCNKMSFDSSGVEQAVRAFFKNDPFYPRPKLDPELWAAFKARYLETSRQILEAEDSSPKSLPDAFIHGIEMKK